MDSHSRLAGTSALIVAAGRSSRMQAFKPLLPLGERTILETAVDTLQSAGIRDILIVTGFQADAVENRLSGRGVRFVTNARFAETQMFDSVKTGLEQLAGRCARFFFLPADLPLFRSQTLSALLKAMQHDNAGFVVPTFGGKRGHPILVDARLIEGIRCYTGEGGLRGALASLDCVSIELAVPDQGILFDADTPADYQALLTYRSTMDNPDTEAGRQQMLPETDSTKR